MTECCLNHGLDGCDLRDANLTGAKLSHATLNGAKLSGAIFAGVLVDDASFKGATGLAPLTEEYLRAKGAKDVD